MPSVAKPEEFLQVPVIFVSPADVAPQKLLVPSRSHFHKGGFMRQQGKGSGFGLNYAVGGSNPSCLALKWSEKRKIMIGLSRIVMTTGCPTPDIMCSVGSEIPGTALRGWLPLLTATVVRR